MSDIPLKKPVAAVGLAILERGGEAEGTGGELGVEGDETSAIGEPRGQGAGGTAGAAKEKEWVVVVNPSREEQARSLLNMTVAGTAEAVLMIEGEASFLPEDTLLDAIAEAHASIRRVCDAMDALRTSAGKPKAPTSLPKEDQWKLLEASMEAEAAEEVRRVLSLTDPLEGGKSTAEARAAMDALSTSIAGRFNSEFGETNVKVAFKKLLVRTMRRMIIETGRRADGRSVDEVCA